MERLSRSAKSRQPAHAVGIGVQIAAVAPPSGIFKATSFLDHPPRERLMSLKTSQTGEHHFASTDLSFAEQRFPLPPSPALSDNLPGVLG
jgi:hypothetical protein